MKKSIARTSIFGLLFLTTVLIAACGEKKAEASAEDIKSEMPAELKDSTVLQQDESSALEKLNSVIDSSEKK